MSEARTELRRARPMPFPRVFSLPSSVVGAAYVAGYVLLDWISFIDPFAPYGITPWNPPTGLSFAVVLLFGQRLIPLLFVAPFLADLTVRQLPFPWTLELAVTVIVGGGYSLALLFLLRPKTRFNPTLPSLRDIFLLLATAAVSSALVAMSYVGAIFAAGILPTKDFGVACLRFWVGDLIGIAVVAPFALILLTRGQLLKLSVETALQFIAIFVALWLVFGFAQKQHLQLFYVLFLPIVWVAVRSGLEGVTIGILLTQLGLIVGVHMLPPADVDVTMFQALMLVMAMTGLMAGTLVTEQRRTEFQLRLHQDSLARLGRLGSMGELAAAVAHEINQPLMAAGTYSRLVLDTLRRERHSDPSVVETAGKVAAQVERASEVVRKLRALVRLDKDARAPTSVERIVNEALDLCQPDLDRNGIRVRANIANNLPPVIVDLLQIEQVLLNIVRNAIDAMNEAGHGSKTITIDANLIKSGDVEVSVRDTGPGFPAELRADQFPPFSTTKAEGLGVGLSLSRTIVEAHGGQLTTGGTRTGLSCGSRCLRRWHPMADDIHIGLIDDDPAVLDALRLYLERNSVRVSCFAAAEPFLATKDIERSFDCVVADVRMPGLSGIDLVREMAARGVSIPVILITAHGEVEMAVGAIKLGAFDFIEKPFDEKRLLESIWTTISRTRQARDDAADLRELRARADSLTERQREVMELAAAGLANKEIALRLHISPRTVEIHRAWMMERMQARNLAELVRMVMRLNASS